MRTTHTIVKKNVRHTLPFSQCPRACSFLTFPRDDVAVKIKNPPPASTVSPHTADATAFATLKKEVDYAWPRRTS